VVIRAIKVYSCPIPLRSPFRIATMETAEAPVTLVSILTQDGRLGWGEATPLHSINGETSLTVVAAIQSVASLLIGRDPRELSSIIDDLDFILPGQHAAISSLDIALHDLASQAAGIPLYQYLGGSHRILPTDQTIGIKPVEEAVAQARGYVTEGHKTIKIKIGAEPESDIDRVSKLRQALGKKIALRVDANQGYSRETALRVLTALEPYDIQFCEQPVRREDRSGMAWLARRSPIPIMADESVFSPHDALDLISDGAVSLFNIKLSKSRGIRRGVEIANIVSTAKGECMIGGMIETRLGMTAAAHLAAAHSVFRYFDLDCFTGHAMDPMVGGATIQNGDVVLPSEPGLGIAPDPTFLETIHPLEFS
jgi:L-alanine-DL-glutamate epimerase-like enolase superfamily enzyme